MIEVALLQLSIQEDVHPPKAHIQSICTVVLGLPAVKAKVTLRIIATNVALIPDNRSGLTLLAQPHKCLQDARLNRQRGISCHQNHHKRRYKLSRSSPSMSQLSSSTPTYPGLNESWYMFSTCAYWRLAISTRNLLK